MSCECERRLLVSYFRLFCQAEDGIRDVAVTGVQTCALPIYKYLVQDRSSGQIYETPQDMYMMIAATLFADRKSVV